MNHSYKVAFIDVASCGKKENRTSPRFNTQVKLTSLRENCFQVYKSDYADSFWFELEGTIEDDNAYKVFENIKFLINGNLLWSISSDTLRIFQHKLLSLHNGKWFFPIPFDVCLPTYTREDITIEYTLRTTYPLILDAWMNCIIVSETDRAKMLKSTLQYIDFSNYRSITVPASKLTEIELPHGLTRTMMFAVHKNDCNIPNIVERIRLHYHLSNTNEDFVRLDYPGSFTEYIQPYFHRIQLPNVHFYSFGDCTQFSNTFLTAKLELTLKEYDENTFATVITDTKTTLKFHNCSIEIVNSKELKE